MHESRYLTAILFGFAISGCSSEPSEAPVSGSQFSGSDTGATEGGFVDRSVGGGIGGGGLAGGGGGFGGGRYGGAAPQSTEIFEGEIDGDYVMQQSGKRIERPRGKGPTPLVILVKLERLPLMPRTDEIGEQLLKFSGSRVRLHGRMEGEVSLGRGHLTGQQGFRGAIPDHMVYFLMVDAVEAL